MSSDRVKVEGEVGMFRDPNSKGIVCDDSAYIKYKTEKDKKLKLITQEKKLNNLEIEVSELKNKLDEILTILKAK
jgi:hypothetical protein